MEEKNKGYLTGRIVTTIIICVTIIWGMTYYVGNMKNTIGAKTTEAAGIINTITVNGDGKVYGKPDILNIQVGITELAQTSKEAQTKVDVGIKKVMDALHTNSVEDKDIQTTEYSLAQELDWNSSIRKVIGQRATQRLMLKIRDIQKDSTRSSKIIDAITLINGVEISSIQFDIDDKTEIYSSARELAYKKADQKARELAKLAGLSLSKPVSIKEVQSEPYYIAPFQNAFSAKSDTLGSSTQIPSGQLEISVQLEVIFGLR